MAVLVLVETGPDGSRAELRLIPGQVEVVNPNNHSIYSVFQEGTLEPPGDLVVRRNGDELEVLQTPEYGAYLDTR